MVTLRVVGRFKLQIYSDDHYPPHFHIVGPDFELLVAIRDRTILKGGRYRREVDEVLRWAAENEDELWALWNRLND